MILLAVFFVGLNLLLVSVPGRWLGLIMARDIFALCWMGKNIGHIIWHGCT
jgi:hypothetical protein